MTGLLHRVAARATGQTAAVRSDARLTSAALQAFAAPIDSLTTPSVAAQDVVPPFHMSQPAYAVWRRDPEPFTGEQPDGPRLHQRHQSLAVHHPTDTGGLEPAQTPPAPLAITHIDQPVHEVHVHTTHIERNIESAARDVHARVRSADRTEPSGREPRDPPLMLPRRQAAPPPAPTSIAGAAPRPSSAAASEDRDVHIHIGSVEVTALHEAAPPRRRPPAVSSPMSLEAYFAKRGRT